MSAATRAAPAAMPADFLDTERRSERALGFWVYLMSDAIIFALVFATYVVLSRNYAGGPTAAELFDLKRTFGETMLLLFSSATFGFATLAMLEGNRARLLVWLALTVFLGAGFVALEIGEFLGMIEAGASPDRSAFLSAFFTLVGLHGLHVSVGLVWIVVLMGQLSIKGLTRPVASRLFRLGLFWHFLDIIWIGIFSVVYLPGVL